MALFKALRNTVNSMVHSLEWHELPFNKAPALWVLMLSFQVTVLLFSVGVRTVLVSHNLEGERGLCLAVNRASSGKLLSQQLCGRPALMAEQQTGKRSK